MNAHLSLEFFDDSTKLGKFLQNLDDDKRTLFELQLNSTKLRFIEASKYNARYFEKWRNCK